jgi:hypothetical protein
MYELFLNPDIRIETSTGGWYILRGIDYPENRPHVPVCKSVPYYHHLNLEIHNWCVEHRIYYALRFYPDKAEFPNYSITFRKESEAMLFKLTWC